MSGAASRPYDAGPDWLDVEPRLVEAARDWTRTRRGAEQGPDLEASVYRRDDGRYVVQFLDHWGEAAGSILTVAQLSAAPGGSSGPEQVAMAVGDITPPALSVALRQLLKPTFEAITEDLDSGSDASAWMDDVDDCAGHASEVLSHLRPGELISLGPDSDIRGVVDEKPWDDLVEPGLAAISWRGGGDASGSVSIPDDTEISVRRSEAFA